MATKDDCSQAEKVDTMWNVLKGEGAELGLIATVDRHDRFIKLVTWMGALILAGITTLVLNEFTGIWKNSVRAEPSNIAPRQHMENNIGIIAPEDDPSQLTPDEVRRGYLTTASLTRIHGCNRDTVERWIHGGKIQPAPVKASGGWQIALDYRLIDATTVMHDSGENKAQAGQQ